jgi:WD40 repeat protein
LPSSKDGLGAIPAIHPDGTLLGRVTRGKRYLKLWELANDRLAAAAVVPRALNCVAFHPTGDLLAVPAEHQTYLYELRRSPVYEAVGMQPDAVENLAFGPGGDTLWTIAPLLGIQGTLIEWSAAPGRARAETARWILPERSGMNAQIEYAAAVDPRRDLLVCAGRTRLWWRDRSGKDAVAIGPVDGVNDLCFDPSGQLWVADHHTLRQASSCPGPLRTVWQSSAADQQAGFTLKCLAAGARSVVVGQRDGKVLHFEQNQLQGTWSICMSEVHCLALSADERLVLAGTELGKVCLLALPSGEIVHQFPDHGDSVTGVAFLGPDLLVSSSRDGTIRLWRPDGTPLLTFETPGPVQRLAVSTDGTRIAAVVEGERAARLWHLDRLDRELDRLGLPLGVEHLRTSGP